MAQYTRLTLSATPGANRWTFSAKTEAEIMADVAGGATSVRSTAKVVRSVIPRAIRAIWVLVVAFLVR